MSRSRKDTRLEGEPEGKDESSLSGRNSIDLRDVEGLSDDEFQPGAPGEDVETKDEPDHKQEPENKPVDDDKEDLLSSTTQEISLHPVTMIHPSAPPLDDDGLNENIEGGVGLPVRRPVEEKGDGLIGLPVAVALKKIANPQSTAADVLLFGNADSKRGYLNAVVAQNDNHLLSIGIDFKILNLPSGKYKISDLAGQERFRSITANYLQNGNIVLLFSGDVDLVSQLRNYGYEIFEISYALRDRQVALVRNDNPFPNERPQVRVLAREASELTANLLPQASAHLAPAAVPARAPLPQPKGFFDRLSGMFGRDDKKEDKKEPPRP